VNALVGDEWPDTAEEIRALYAHMFETLQGQYDKTGIVTDFEVTPCKEAEAVEQSLRADLGWGDDVHMAVSDLFETPKGPILGSI